LFAKMSLKPPHGKPWESWYDILHVRENALLRHEKSPVSPHLYLSDSQVVFEETIAGVLSTIDLSQNDPRKTIGHSNSYFWRKCRYWVWGCKSGVAGGMQRYGPTPHHGISDEPLMYAIIDLALSSSNQSKLEDAVSALRSAPTLTPDTPISINTFVCDLANLDTLDNNVCDVLNKVSAGGKIDHIVYAAGDPINLTPLEERSVKSMISSGVTRFFAPIVVAKEAKRYIEPGPKSSISFTGGIISKFPTPGWTFHAAYFAGLEGATRSLAVELKPVRVNIVSPGPVETSAWGNIPPEMRKALEDIVLPKCATGSVATIDEVAEAYIYLMRNTCATGSLVEVDCGCSVNIN
jgi:NAD(P)-dependent dehydrogenase (short-subunit alcohol dehydrogenase family)